MRCDKFRVAEVRAKIEEVVNSEEDKTAAKASLAFEKEEGATPDDANSEMVDIYFVCDPYFFRNLDKLKGCELRVVDAQVVKEGDVNLDDEVARIMHDSNMLGSGDRYPEDFTSSSSGKGPGTRQFDNTNFDGGNDANDIMSSQPKAELKCSTCGPYHEENFRVHVKTDWHTHNIKRRCKQLEPYTFDEHREYLLDSEFIRDKKDKDLAV